MTIALAAMADWPTTLRFALLTILVLTSVGFWSLHVAVGPIQVGFR